MPWLPRLLMNMRTKSARSTVLRQMKVNPSPTSVRRFATVSGATEAGSTSCSGGMRMKTTNEGTYRIADSQSALADPYTPPKASAPTATPPRLGPTMRATRSAVR